MSENEYNRRAHAALQRELDELNTVRARYQAQLDRFWGERRYAEAETRRIKRECDPYNLGLNRREPVRDDDAIILACLPVELFPADRHRAVARILRRVIIRNALRASEETFKEFYRRALKQIDGPGAVEDFRAVERHLDEQHPLFDDLRKRTQI